MRTTIEITDSQRAKLLEIAAQRGLKGFSPLVREAIDRYLESHRERDEKRKAALGAAGSLAKEEADALAERVANIRERWR